MTTQLDPRDARPLTSREISKVLCSIIAGVVVYDERARAAVPAVIDAVRRSAPDDEVTNDGWWKRRSEAQRYFVRSREASWATALSATVSGFRGWCDPSDIATALSWVADHLDEICPPLAAVTATQ